MLNIKNASPQVVLLGTDDQSGKNVPIKPIPLPTHLPKFYSYFQRGPLTPQLVDGNTLLRMYGEDSFDVEGPYYNPAMKFLMDILGKGNSCMVQRVVPPSLSVVANVTLYLDIVKDKIVKYKRNNDGSITKDSQGTKVIDDDSPIDGYRIKVIAERNFDDVTSDIGAKTAKEGYMLSADGVKSTMYPILEMRGAYVGADYNNSGFSIDLVSEKEIDEEFISAVEALPFKFTIFRKKKDGSPSIVKDLNGSVNNIFTFKPNAKLPSVNVSLELKDVITRWSNTTDPLYDLRYPDFDEPYVYEDNLDTILDKLYETEKPFINANFTTADGSIVNTHEWFDFISDDDAEKNKYLINPFNGYSTKRVFYFSIAVDQSIVTTAPEHKDTYLVGNIPVYLGNGSDGDLSVVNLESAIANELDKYIDENSEVQDMAVNVENVMYDVGYSFDLKLKMINFISLRKDTFLILSTHEYYKKEMSSLVDHRAKAVSLRSRLQLASESTYFGTGVARALVVIGDGKISSFNSKKPYPQSYDIAIKSALMMGSTKWKKEKLFTKGSTNVIETMYDLKPAFIPQGVKASLWNEGVVWSQPYDFNRYHFPAMQTIYDDDTSILNNYFNAMALTVINKVAAKIWRAFTGVVELSPDELISEVETMAHNELKDVFGGVVTVIPRAMITSYDEQLGYSWTMVFKLAGNVSKTVMLTYIVALRASDLQ